MILPSTLLPTSTRPLNVTCANYPDILLSNARSIFPKFDELSILVSTLRPDIIAITESWLHKDIPNNLLALNNYVFCRVDRQERIGGGVCLWVHERFPSLPVPCVTVPTTVELLIIKIVSLRLLFSVIYIPPSLTSSEKKDVADFLIHTFDKQLLICPEFKIVLCGDLNTFDTSIFPLYFNLTNHVLLPTRGDAFLDQIWVDSSLQDVYETSADVGPNLASSDHRTVVLRAKGKPPVAAYRVVKIRDYRASHLAAFCEILTKTDFSVVESEPCVEKKCSLFYQLLHLADSVIPSDYVVMTSDDKPWITPVLKSLINKRWQAYRSKNWPLYNHFKHKTKYEITKAKRAWASRQISSTKGVWKLVKELSGTGTSKSHHRSNDVKEAHQLLLDLTRIFQRNFNAESDVGLEPLNDESWNPAFSVSEIENELSRLSLKKAAGSDSIDAILLKTGAPWLSAPLCDIFRVSVDARIIIPRCWKMANVVPIPKCSTPSSEDYRPISLISLVGKLFERIILKSVKQELLCLYGAQQHAFRPRGSTTSALVQIHDTITRYLDMSNVDAVRLTCLDLSKAFDKLHHNRLLNYLAANDVNKGFVLWLRDYLCDRQQRVKINGNFGPTIHILSGVPQGSVLGPYLCASFMGSLC